MHHCFLQFDNIEVLLSLLKSLITKEPSEMRGIKKIILSLALLAAGFAWSQEAEPELSLEGGTIESQFEFLYRKSGNYNAEGRRYEVVRKLQLDKLRDNILDSLSGARSKVAELNATITRHEGTIEDLNGKLENTTAQLTEVTEEKDSMSFFGIQVSKITYNLILWTIIIVLMLFLLLHSRNRADQRKKMSGPAGNS